MIINSILEQYLLDEIKVNNKYHSYDITIQKSLKEILNIFIEVFNFFSENDKEYHYYFRIIDNTIEITKTSRRNIFIFEIIIYCDELKNIICPDVNDIYSFKILFNKPNTFINFISILSNRYRNRNLLDIINLDIIDLKTQDLSYNEFEITLQTLKMSIYFDKIIIRPHEYFLDYNIFELDYSECVLSNNFNELYNYNIIKYYQNKFKSILLTSKEHIITFFDNNDKLHEKIITCFWIVKNGIKYYSLLDKNIEYYIDIGKTIFEFVSQKINIILKQFKIICILNTLNDFLKIKEIRKSFDPELLFNIYKYLEIKNIDDYLYKDYIQRYIKSSNCLYLSKFSLKVIIKMINKKCENKTLYNIFGNDLIVSIIDSFL